MNFEFMTIDTPFSSSCPRRVLFRSLLQKTFQHTETRQSDRGIVYPIADTSGDFRRLYDRNFAENRPETIH